MGVGEHDPTSRVRSAADAFIRLIRSRDLPPPDELVLHLRFPKSSWLTFRGSQLGAELWESEEGVAIFEALLAYPGMREAYGPPPPSRSSELIQRTATFVIAALRSGQSGATFLDQQLRVLLGELLAENAVWSAAWLVEGLEVSSRLPITAFIDLLPVTESDLEMIARRLPGGAVTLPRNASAVLYLRCSTSRATSGAYTASAGFGWAHVLLLQLSKAVWLATGGYPTPIVRLASEEATFPIGSPTEDLASVIERSRHYDSATADQGSEIVIRALMARLHGRPWATDQSEWDAATRVALDAAIELSQTAIESLDALVVNFACYAAIDGLLSAREDDDTATVRRVAQIVGTDDRSRRAVRRRVTRLYHLRSDMAHGRSPHLADIASALELPTEPSVALEQRYPSLYEELRLSSLRLLRLVLAFCLHATSEVQDQMQLGDIPNDVRPRLAIGEFRAVLDRAERDPDARAQVEALMPSWLQPARRPPGAPIG